MYQQFQPIIDTLIQTLPYNPEKYLMISAISSSFKKRSTTVIGYNNTQFNKNLKHCEIKALENFSRLRMPKHKSVDICIFRIDRQCNIRNSKPCQNCIRELKSCLLQHSLCLLCRSKWKNLPRKIKKY